MRAMLLCAGLSTRLGPLGAERPKPMLPVCGIPILAYGVANLVAHGVTELVINTHHLGEVIQRELGDGRQYGARIQYIHEPVILGTGGGLKHALALLDPDGRDEPFLSCNGKLIFDVDLTALVDAYRRAAAGEAAAGGELLGMMVVRRVPDALDWGAVDVQDGRVRDILGTGEHMFCGVHVTRPSVVARLPDGEACMIRQGYLPWLRAGGVVRAFDHAGGHAGGYFAEHSTPERYVESNRALLGGAQLRHPPGRLTGIDPMARIHPSASIEEPVRIGAGAVIGPGVAIGPYTVVGDGAVVNASISGAVVWAGARVDAPPAGPIVT
ncbi:MAG TPA: NDP-sugar synthase [Kofleriaceae bacterium]|nr:NDP-sugar synthase [Kofleriaceae bacterium]